MQKKVSTCKMIHIQDISKQVGRTLSDNAPAILTGVGITGTVTTAIFAGKASFKAADLIRESEAEEGTPEDPKERLIERTKLTWTLYIPAVGVGSATIACILFANQIGTRRTAAVAAAYSMSERAFTEYREKVVEKIGSPKEQEVRDEVAQDLVSNTPNTNEVVIVGSGDVLCFDQFTGRYFNSSMENLKQAQNNLNYQLIRESYASLNDFYDRVGLGWTPSGDELGWTCGDPMELRFSTVMSPDNRPCISIDFSVVPVRNFYKNY